MSKELILQELDIRNLDFISNLQPESVIECCQVSLAYLARGNHLSSKALTKAASKLSLEPRELKYCLEALAHLFWQSTKQMKNKSRCLTSYQRLGIPNPEMLTDFCFEEVMPMLKPTLEALGEKDGETFCKLEWRLEGLLQTRGEQVREIQAMVSIKLNDDITFDADAKTLDELAFKLEGALVTMKCPLVKKLQRFL